MALLEVKDLNTGYGPIQALWSVSLNVENKGITTLLGANGAGKSTFLSCIVGLQKLWSGDIIFDNKSITKIKANKRTDQGISLVPEGRRIFFDMSVKENLIMGAFAPNAREKMSESFEEVYAMFPVLKERTGQRAGTLSGGEQQMLAIARALMARPKLLMLDEVSTGLSPVLTTMVMDTLAKIGDTLPILVVEQAVEKALEISHTAYVLENGKIVMQGKSDELRQDENLRKAYMGI
ncbi:ABC transporter ATP-binding protein [Candidatus Bathyarchaeota archaeon]|jgi:branched-chain amino acid transport system ATP-binding protein|nr:ABC transporter ATP-binding protein [Candidatus Bathyarchaeota archaeon]